MVQWILWSNGNRCIVYHGEDVVPRGKTRDVYPLALARVSSSFMTSSNTHTSSNYRALFRMLKVASSREVAL